MLSLSLSLFSLIKCCLCMCLFICMLDMLGDLKMKIAKGCHMRANCSCLLQLLSMLATQHLYTSLNKLKTRQQIIAV